MKKGREKAMEKGQIREGRKERNNRKKEGTVDGRNDVSGCW